MEMLVKFEGGSMSVLRKKQLYKKNTGSNVTISK
jgi:hypothetical protein